MTMSIASHPTTQQLIAELYKVEGKAEIVNGEIVLMSPTGDMPGHAASEIFVSLRLYAKQHGGIAYTDNIAFLVDLPHRNSFCPDAAYYTGPRAGMQFLPQAPDFAIEVRSEGDYGPSAELKMAKKRSDYFAAGTKVVWDVDLLSADAVIRVFRATEPTKPSLYKRGETAEAEPAVPGWSFAVNDLFQ
jgi:Uma2 family endonuclease